MHKYRLLVLSALLLGLTSALSQEKPATPADLLREAVQTLLKLQDPSGAWAYEGVYRVNKDLPVGYRVGGTSAVGSTLLAAAPKDEAARAAARKGLAYVLKELDDPLMAPSTEPRYDVRVWGHACALEFLCTTRAAKNADTHLKDVVLRFARVRGSYRERRGWVERKDEHNRTPPVACRSRC